MNIKIKKKVRGEGSGGMCTKNGSYCREKEKSWGGGAQGRCEQISEAFVKIQKKNGGGGGGQGGCEQRSEAFCGNLQKKYLFFWGVGVGSGGGWGRGGVRVDVNGEVKFL